eukprot:TRINITY_DN1134_c0_g1_i2.p1 TRINITY_DN1134_c0_g1~~TRINITY_DN1134_c0_g1_i2.p1  ORF type:complete len:622 (+),score=119.92 TRINITY_DN1134_c0_g1_i2:81-1946(+)
MALVLSGRWLLPSALLLCFYFACPLTAQGASNDTQCKTRMAGPTLLQQRVSRRSASSAELSVRANESLHREHVAATPHELMTCPGTPVMTTTCMTVADYDAVTNSVRGLLESLPETCTASVCPQADWAGCVLRMAGHDFMDFVDGQGGSDGCTDMADPDNAGLDACLRTGEHGLSLTQVYQTYCTTVSLADFLVIAAEAVMASTRARHVAATPGAANIDFRSGFRFGRTTAATCDFAEGRLPNPENGCGAVEETFVNGMGLDWTESAALMGVHTLGRAHIGNSGYHGWWSDPEHSRRFNNNYYVALVAKGWIPELAISGNVAKNQWERSDIGLDDSFDGHEMMLNTDLCLVYSENAGRDSGPVLAQVHDCCAWLNSNAIQGAVQNNGGEYCGGSPQRGATNERAQCCGAADANDCGNRGAPTGPAAQAVLQFAADDNLWLNAFMRAWHIATENGFETSLHSLGQCQSTTVTASATTTTTATTAATTTVSTSATTTTTTISVPTTPDGFFSVDGGINRACRGADTSDNQAAHYRAVSANSLDECKAACVQDVGCQGIEFNLGLSRCEVWIRPNGIGATVSAAGFACLRYESTGISTTTTTTMSNGGGGRRRRRRRPVQLSES